MTGQSASLTWSHNRKIGSSDWAYGTRCQVVRRAKKQKQNALKSSKATIKQMFSKLKRINRGKVTKE